MEKLTLTALLLCITWAHYASGTAIKSRKILHFSNQQLMFNEFYHINDQVAYALCDNSNIEDEKNCTVVREKFPFQGPPYTCNITFKAEHENGKLAPYFTVVPFGEDNVIVGWSEKDMRNCLKLTTIKMSSCKSSETRVFTGEGFDAYPDTTFTAMFTGYKDSYDVFFRNYDLCNQTFCKITVDVDSNVINGPVSVVNHHLCAADKQALIPLSLDSPDKGLFYVACDGETRNAYVLVQPNGTDNRIAIVDHNGLPNGQSIANGMISLCYKPKNDSFNCTKQDLNGDNFKQLTLNTKGKWDEMVDMYNLPNGGFLILGHNTNYVRKFTLMKFDSDGKEIGTLTYHIGKVTAQISFPQVFQNSNNDYCISTVLYYLHNRGTESFIDMRAECYTDADFS